MDEISLQNLVKTNETINLQDTIKSLNAAIENCIKNQFDDTAKVSIKNKFAVVSTGSVSMETNTGESDLDVVLIISKDVDPEKMFSILQKVPEIESMNHECEKIVDLWKIKFRSTDVDIAICQIEEDFVPMNAINGIFVFKNSKSLIAFKGLLVKNVIVKSVDDWEIYVNAVKLIKIFCKCE